MDLRGGFFSQVKSFKKSLDIILTRLGFGTVASCKAKNTLNESVQELAKYLGQRRFVIVDLLNYTKEGKPFWNRLALLPILEDYYVGFQNSIDQDPKVLVSKFSVPIVEGFPLEFEQLILAIEEGFLKLLKYSEDAKPCRLNSHILRGNLILFKQKLLSLSCSESDVG